MKYQVLVILAFLAAVSCRHRLLGNVNNNRHLIHQTRVYSSGIPFVRRVKNMFYSGHYRINSIMAYDNLHTKATITITAGGIGYTYINLRFQSERGKPLDFEIGIYA